MGAGGCTFPHDSQKCAARMDPHDQQDDVGPLATPACAPSWVSCSAIDNFTTEALSARPVARREGCAVVEVSTQIELQPLYAEKDVPQPHDLLAFGFTNTKPCCIRVSW